jgi:hypothetical protein
LEKDYPDLPAARPHGRRTGNRVGFGVKHALLGPKTEKPKEAVIGPGP